MRQTNAPGFWIDERNPNVVINRNDKDLKSYRALVDAERRVQNVEQQLQNIMQTLVKIEAAAKGA